MKTHRGLFFLLLGFGRFTFGRGSVLRLGFAIGLGFSNLSGDGFGASPARAPAGFPVFPLPFFLIGRLCYLDDDLAVVKLLLIKEVDGILGSFSRGEGDEPIARGPSSAQDDLGGDAVNEARYVISIDITRGCARSQRGKRKPKKSRTCRSERARKTPSALHPR